MIGGIRTCLGVSDDPMFLWISSNSCPLNLLLVRSHQAEIIIVKRLIQGRNNVTWVQVEPRSFDQGRRKNDAFTHSATLPIMRRIMQMRRIVSKIHLLVRSIFVSENIHGFSTVAKPIVMIFRHRRSQGGPRGPGPPPIEIPPMIKNYDNIA